MGYGRFDSRNCRNCKYFNDPVNFTIPEILDSCKHPEHFVPRAIIYNKENNFQFCDDHVFKYKRRKEAKLKTTRSTQDKPTPSRTTAQSRSRSTRG